MNRDSFEEKDTLRNYINPAGREIAPDGFTERVMNRIDSETVPYTSKGIFTARIAVPAITIIVTVALMAVAFIFVPRSGNNIFPEIFSALETIRISLPEIKADWLNFVSIPAIAIYIAAGFLALTLFDRLLNRMFHS